MEEENSNVQSSVSENTNAETTQVNANANTQASKENKAKNILSNVLKNKKLLGIIAAVIVVVIALMVIVPNIVGGPKKAVKNYISALSSGNGEKIIKSMDVKGSIALRKSSDEYSFTDLKVKDSKFVDNYKDVDKDDVDDKKDTILDTYKNKNLSEHLKKSKIKVIRFNEVEKYDDCKDLYKITAKVRVSFKDDDGDKQNTAQKVTFYVYKNKVIYSTIDIVTD